MTVSLKYVCAYDTHCTMYIRSTNYMHECMCMYVHVPEGLLLHMYVRTFTTATLSSKTI